MNKSFAFKYSRNVISLTSLSVMIISCASRASNHATQVYAEELRPDYEIVVNSGITKGIVSHNLMGFNLEYNNETDSLWNCGYGPIPAKIALLKPGQLRWPGGTLTTFYHWNQPDGVQGHRDSWDADFDARKNTPPKEFMNIDEYLGTARKLRSDLLIGINLSSGKRLNKQQQGIEEAQALVEKVKKYAAANMPGAQKFFYLDNEPYAEDANFTFDPESYAREINAYVPALKRIDPTIRIIANSKNEPKDPVWTSRIIQIAGANIDYIDIHYYWRWNALSFDIWKSESVMMNQQARPFSEERVQLKQIAKANGHPDIDLVSFEWNLGRKIAPGANAPTESEVALMVAEQFTEFVQSGMPMACFWPIQFPRNPAWNRAVLDATKGYSTNKVYDMFKLYTSALNQMQIETGVKAMSGGDEKRIRTFAIKSTDRKAVEIYIINKDQSRDEADIDLVLAGSTAKKAHVEAFDATDTGHGNLKVYTVPSTTAVSGNNIHLRFKMQKNSFTKVTLTRK